MDCKAWLPAGMDPLDKQEFIDANPGDCHGAAADAWEAWAAGLQGTASGGMGVQSVQTGAQSVTYSDSVGSGEAGEAMRRAAWHRARALTKSVPVGPEHQVGMAWRPGLRLFTLGERDGEDSGVIPTYDIDAEGPMLERTPPDPLVGTPVYPPVEPMAPEEPL